MPLADGERHAGARGGQHRAGGQGGQVGAQAKDQHAGLNSGAVGAADDEKPALIGGAGVIGAALGQQRPQIFPCPQDTALQPRPVDTPGDRGGGGAAAADQNGVVVGDGGKPVEGRWQRRRCLPGADHSVRLDLRTPDGGERVLKVAADDDELVADGDQGVGHTFLPNGQRIESLPGAQRAVGVGGGHVDVALVGDAKTGNDVDAIANGGGGMAVKGDGQRRGGLPGAQSAVALDARAAHGVQGRAARSAPTGDVEPVADADGCAAIHGLGQGADIAPAADVGGRLSGADWPAPCQEGQEQGCGQDEPDEARVAFGAANGGHARVRLQTVQVHGIRLLSRQTTARRACGVGSSRR